MRWGGDRGSTKDRQHGRGGHMWAAPMAMLSLLCCAALLVTGCAAQASAKPTATAPHVTPTVTATLGPTVTPAPTPIQITDLGQFRQKFQDAFGSGKWSNVAPLLSPNFSFQSPHAGSHLLMPYSIQNLQTVFEGGGPWVDSGYYTSFFSCYAGTTPSNQIVGYIGHGGDYGGAFLMFGLAKWQGYWVVGWGFDDPVGPGDGISCHIEGA